jgi:hypothetical protein
MKAYIDFVGAILGAGTFGLSDDELRAIGDFTRENVLGWMECHGSPDWVGILPIKDFHAVCGDIDIPWATAEYQKIWVSLHPSANKENLQ